MVNLWLPVPISCRRPFHIIRHFLAYTNQITYTTNLSKNHLTRYSKTIGSATSSNRSLTFAWIMWLWLWRRWKRPWCHQKWLITTITIIINNFRTIHLCYHLLTGCRSWVHRGSHQKKNKITMFLQRDLGVSLTMLVLMFLSTSVTSWWRRESQRWRQEKMITVTTTARWYDPRRDDDDASLHKSFPYLVEQIPRKIIIPGD